jgi:CheY-like chemotaxis protein
MARILVIDDEAPVCEAIEALLEGAGHDVSCAADGFQAIVMHRTAHFDLVITDIIMPEMEGIETIKAIRETTPEIGIIAVSGGGRLEPKLFLRAALILGADATFTKPFANAELLAKVAELLETTNGLDGKRKSDV